MLHALLQKAVNDAAMMGPAVLINGKTELRRLRDIVDALSLSIDDKRAILAAWASDYSSVESKPAFRQIPGLAEPVTIDELQSALKELDVTDRRGEALDQHFRGGWRILTASRPLALFSVADNLSRGLPLWSD